MAQKEYSFNKSLTPEEAAKAKEIAKSALNQFEGLKGVVCKSDVDDGYWFDDLLDEDRD